ncbi:hypothetical protein RHD99_08175 [Buttiauxella selenatireducens]|uniref:Glycosyltransferase RgtA/B/C/D-like domain-containing protein n=1 Tax=Buttiauxella selenatireducens TaxID=3073902 RepID=A0ABY9SEG2_9ENTR|nr:hypothetical protein [Buttiauxella sp. R73]WMY75903.1 hypothetical protein RHD99_08175 [Buttiauxella sp. R73]
MNKQNSGVVFVTVFLSLFFLVLAIGYAHSYNPGFFPDEFAHMGYVVDVIKNKFPDYNNGLVFSSNKLNYLNHPALYYVIVGELASLLHLQDMYANVGRYVNMIISIIIIILTCRMLYATTKSMLATFTGGAFLLVIPMFVVLGSAINNDQINVLGCTLVIYGLLGLIEVERKNKSLTSSVIIICIGGIVASLSKATGSLVIVCLLVSVALFNFSTFIKIIKKISLKEWLLIILSILIIIFYFACVHAIYDDFYPAPQGNPALWFFIENPNAKRLDFLEFLVNFFKSNLVTITIPYGHVPIIDSETRIVILKSILIMLGGMSSYILAMKLSKNNTFFNLEFSFIIAFAIYITVYVFTIRQLHLNTGYMGAMQARYFFGFLPVCSLVIGKFICYVNSKIFQIIVFMLMVSGLITSIYPALVKFTDLRMLQSTIIIEQPLYNTSYGYLTKGRGFEQAILAESNSLNGVELMLATYARNNHGALILELLDGSGVIIASDIVKMETIKDNSYTWFDFNNVKLKKNQKYLLRLKCNDCTQSNAITWWAVKKEVESHVFLLTKFGPGAGDAYSKGEAYVDGAKIGGAFAFRLYF